MFVYIEQRKYALLLHCLVGKFIDLRRQRQAIVSSITDDINSLSYLTRISDMISSPSSKTSTTKSQNYADFLLRRRFCEQLKASLTTGNI